MGKNVMLELDYVELMLAKKTDWESVQHFWKFEAKSSKFKVTIC